MTEKEKWKDIEGYEGLYKISNLGRVLALDKVIFKKNGVKMTIRGRYKKFTNLNGYKLVILTKDGENVTVRVHRLVAKAFIPAIEGKEYVDHIDGNRSNNNVDNLRWCTKKENNNFPLSIKHKSDAQKGLKNALGKKRSESQKIAQSKRMILQKGKPVIQYTLDNKFVKEYDCITTASRATGIAKQNIHKCCNLTAKRAGNYKWEYKK